MSVSVRDVAERASVSVGTVSNVLNRPEKVAPATVERVMRAIDELGFVRNDAARQLRAGRSRTIGLVVLDARNPFFADVASGAEGRAAGRGLAVLLANSDETSAREDTYLSLFEEQRAFGVLVTPVSEDLRRLRRLRERGIPVVLVDRESSDATFPSVSVDDVAGGRLAAQHLLDLGRQRLAFVGGPAGIRQVADRLRGAQQAVAATPGAILEPVVTRSLTVQEGREVGRRLRERPPGERPDAVFAANDLLALGILQSLVMVGDLRVPEDIALIGYDDIDFASAAVVPLSSIRQPASLLGETAVDLLLREVAEPESSHERSIRFRPELVVRASTLR
ncbi:LacI family DNA-binding transcriptional regulator [Microbacterium sp. 18062]|uniref:LacI family DNA-binding transcriptional regulator n=1 Tax=Microbacterium sp. 18062 TaxID=2681410 RepID=UPI00135BF265|nr:LacI family DNA-binding transcriptional regulator [Microbacterium sp. 18062]